MASRKRLKPIVTICITILVIALTIVANVLRGKMSVRQVEVKIDYDEFDTLVTSDQIAAQITKAMPEIFDTPIADVDCKAVANVAASSPYLRNCEASTSVIGDVIVYAVQRRPIVRVFTSDKEFFLDTQGKQVPISKVGDCDVIVANGSIKTNGKSEELIYNLAFYLDEHPDYAVLFDQIYLDDKQDLYLTPKLGNHIVQVGSPEDLDQKFSNLVALYTRGFSQTGWDAYKQVSLKYKGQIVCRRNPAGNPQ